MKENGLSDKKIKQLKNQPIIETFINRSTDGKWMIHKTVITDIKPIGFYKKIFEHAGGPV